MFADVAALPEMKKELERLLAGTKSINDFITFKQWKSLITLRSE